ncbi:hypothetical protein N0V82_009780 [Gnomoniopsis sp. IMI 355080]|nr:hypothetical protein N0V82_009780 [Gnomoniopsis sp. IMI 355080]
MPPVEVIDLLSSSPAAVVPPQRPPKTKAAARPNKAPPAGILDYDILDLTADDNGRHAMANKSTSPIAALAKPPSNSSISARDFSCFSDDFGTDADLFDEIFDERPAKKLRPAGPSDVKGAVSSTSTRPLQRAHSGPEKSAATSTFISASTGTISRGAPGILQPAGLRRFNTTVDPIQTSSDPFASSPRQERGKENKIIDLSLDDGLDPFASSPPLIKDKGAGKEKASKASVPSRERRSGQHASSSPYSSKVPGKQPISPQARKASVLSSPLLMESGPASKMTGQPKQTRSKGKEKNIVPWDNISSSAPEVNLDDDWDMGVARERKSLARSRSDGVKFDLGDPDTFPTDSDDDLPDLGNLKPPKSKSSVSKSISKVTKRQANFSSKQSLAEIESARLDKLAAREAEKRRKQREKDEAKEQRRIEKERAAALAEVNKIRTDKKVSTPEMIVDLSNSIPPSTKLQIEAILADLNVNSHSYASPVNNVVKWRRKVRARFNDTEGHWEPIPERIEPEKHALVIVPAAEFIELALGAKGSDLEAHVLNMQRNHKDHTLIYLIEGLHGFMRKNANVRNRQFQAAVRATDAGSTDDAPPPSTQQRKRKASKPPPPHIDKNLIEDALLSLQVYHNALIHHTSAPIETAQWVAIFTRHISTIPYRHQKDTTTASAAFCMDSGQVRTGENAHDTYLKMLQEIARVTAPIAYGIAGEFGTVGDLVRGLENGGPLVLEGVRKSANKDGAFSERCLGQAVSRRVWKVFTGRDENSTDI